MLFDLIRVFGAACEVASSSRKCDSNRTSNIHNTYISAILLGRTSRNSFRPTLVPDVQRFASTICFIFAMEIL